MLDTDTHKIRPEQKPPAEPTQREIVAEWMRRALDPEDRLHFTTVEGETIELDRNIDYGISKICRIN